MKKIIITLCIAALGQFAFAQRMIKNIDPQKSYRNIRGVVKTSDYVIFIANDSVHGDELWRTTGTEASTHMIKDINPGINGAWGHFSEYNLMAIGEKVFFNADNGTDGEELWVTDGSNANTVMLKDINSGTGWGQPRYFHNFRDTLYFSAYDNVNGFELWKSDGTTAGTVMIKKISTKTSPSQASNPNGFVQYKDELYFVANDYVSGAQIWKTNGSEAGTVRVSNVNSPSGLWPNDMFVAGDLIYFRASSGSNNIELWKCDGTEAGTVLVKDINSTVSSNPSVFGALNGKLFFKADDGTNGQELWTSDGTDTGTFMLKDCSAGSVSGLISHNGFANYKNDLYFTARGTGEQNQVWKTDGTAAGTIKVTNLPGSGNLNPNTYSVIGNTLYFRAIHAVDGSNAYELFKTDGTVAGTSLVKNINLQANGSANIQYLTEFYGKIYFAANDTTNGDELWVLDNAITFGGNITRTECDSFILDGTSYKTTGTHLHYLNNSHGFDSLITLNLTLIEKPVIQRNGNSLTSSTIALNYKWYLNGAFINGATSRSYIPTQNGNYTVEIITTVSGKNNCSKTSNAYTLNNVSVIHHGHINISIYPNPANTFINIITNEKLTGVKIINQTGQTVLNAQKSTIDIAHLPTGVYFIQTHFLSGNIITSRLIKQ